MSIPISVNPYLIEKGKEKIENKIFASLEIFPFLLKGNSYEV